MKHFNLKNHPLAFFLVLVLSLAAIAATANYFDGNLTPRTDDAYDLGETTKEWRNALIDGYVKADSIALDGGGNLVKTMTYCLTDVTTAKNLHYFTLVRAIQFVRGDMTMPQIVAGGTVGVTITSGSAQQFGLTTIAEAATNTTQTAFASGSVCTLKVMASGASDIPAILTLQYYDD